MSNLSAGDFGGCRAAWAWMVIPHSLFVIRCFRTADVLHRSHYSGVDTHPEYQQCKDHDSSVTDIYEGC